MCQLIIISIFFTLYYTNTNTHATFNSFHQSVLDLLRGNTQLPVGKQLGSKYTMFAMPPPGNGYGSLPAPPYNGNMANMPLELTTRYSSRPAANINSYTPYTFSDAPHMVHSSDPLDSRDLTIAAQAAINLQPNIQQILAHIQRPPPQHTSTISQQELRKEKNDMSDEKARPDAQQQIQMQVQEQQQQVQQQNDNRYFKNEQVS